MKYFGLILSIAFLMGCGADTPFQRGLFKGSGDPDGSKKEVTLDESFFNEYVQPALAANKCILCHESFANFNEAKERVVPGSPDDSPLYVKPLGDGGHSKRWEEDSEEAQTLADWILGATDS